MGRDGIVTDRIKMKAECCDRSFSRMLRTSAFGIHPDAAVSVTFFFATTDESIEAAFKNRGRADSPSDRY